MGRKGRFPPPTVTTLSISSGDTLTVKRQLNAGESRRAWDDMVVETEDGDLRVDRRKRPIALMLAYLVDWSLTDDDGTAVVIRHQPRDVVLAALDALDTDTFLEVKNAIEDHDIEVMKARLAAKNDQGGETGSSATSPSPVDAAGVTSGSSS